METDCIKEALPSGTRLLHIGPHKTGTTAIQGALFAAKDTMPEHGVDFPAHSRHPMEAALAACARPAMMGDTVPTDKHWTRLLDAVRATGDRTSVISSEFFADAEDDEAIARIVEQLGGERVHILITLRPLAKIMPSQWQQYVQNGLRMGYDNWLEHMLRKRALRAAQPQFLAPAPARPAGGALDPGRGSRAGHRRRGRRQRPGRSCCAPSRRCSDCPRICCDRCRTRRTALSPSPRPEMLRKLNVEFRGNGLPDELYSKLVRNGAVMHMKNSCSPTPQDVKITTPQWAVEAARLDRRRDGRHHRRHGRTDRRRHRAPVGRTEGLGAGARGAADRARGGRAGAVRGARGGGRRAGAAHRAGEGADRPPDVVEGTRTSSRSPLPEEAAAPLRGVVVRSQAVQDE
ncbi:hypothetical protein ACRAWF_34780 [Streptomyces sp. L7]